MKKLILKKGRIFFWIFAFGWGGFVLNYLAVSGWWQTRGTLSPMEVVGGIGGLAMPVLILFLVASYYDRSERVETEAKKMRIFMEELIYPDEEGAVYTKELTNELRNQIKEFRSVYTGVTEHTDKVRENLQRWIEGLNKLVKTVDTQTVGAVQKMADHIEKLAKITHQSNQQAEQTTTLLAGQADILKDITHKTNAIMAGFSKELNAEIQEVQNLAHAMEVARGQIMSSEGDSAKIVKALTENVGRLEQTLAQYGSLGEIEKQAEKTTKEVALAGEKVQLQTRALQSVLNQMQGDMTLIAQGLNAHTEALEKHLNLKENQKHDLLIEASSIVTQLQQFSVELAHLFSPKNEELLWKRYYAGDKAVFMRHLREEIRMAKAEKVRKLYRENISFQSAVNHYMQAFEQMTHEAKESAPDSPLLGVLVGSDVGRLYMVLAQVIKGGNA
ncbi:MAG: hypothetical protein J6T55_01925 [Alphaproteobacteria bacterium]|nr:hypothetical protein [Alphaproteobacteria bacterium]